MSGWQEYAPTMTPEEERCLRSMTTAEIRRCYWLCDAQLVQCYGDPSKVEAATKLNAWQSTYLDELVRRGARV